MPEELRKALIRYISGRFPNLREVGQDAEDIVNQAFVKFYSGRIKTASDLHFGYLSKIAFNLAKDCFNRQKAQVSLDEIAPFLADQDQELIALENEKPDQNQLNDALQSLKIHENEVVSLHYFGEHTFQEISDLTGIKLNTVLSHHRRGIENLRNHFSLLEKEIPVSNKPKENTSYRQYRNFQLLED